MKSPLPALLAIPLLVLAGCDRAASTNGAPSPSAAPAASSAASASTPSASAAPAAAAPASALTRETKTVVVDGVTETWRLVWGSAPTPACADASWSSCDCQSFAFAETGPLSLVRSRPGSPDEVLDLTETIQGKKVLPIVRKTAALPTDKKGKAPTAAELEKRPVVEAMKLGDYDGDGRATELVFAKSDRKGIDKCGKVRAVVVGISKSNPKLHVFRLSLVEDKKPIVTELHLDPAEWEQLRTKKQLSYEKWGCDHGATSHPVSTIAPASSGTTELVETEKDEACN